MLTDEYRYKILKVLEDDPHITQRELAKRLDVSLGWVNACLKQMADEQLIESLRLSGQSHQFVYQLMPTGRQTKNIIAVSVLITKKAQLKALERDISELEAELKQSKAPSEVPQRARL
ncbi:winged helix-turn-helix transcriptional regulator [uncultured Gilvimarinus sp.]|uniref:winged helix-turn-helix transcriptional regulator n=1 Tax=uncultured Gilvimarinus sp. TaxID=1689143 RepID=UPI0030EECBB4|tara:strand:- start:6783 stop:7136 length:354 start_codon:yes stop_codon:yes gene_type:complete